MSGKKEKKIEFVYGCYCGDQRSSTDIFNDKTKSSENKPKKCLVDLRCDACHKFYHQHCFVKQIENPPLDGDWHYSFLCKTCNNGVEDYKLLERDWYDVVQISVYNLQTESGDPHGSYVTLKAIQHFVDANWDRLCTGRTKTMTWKSTIARTLSTSPKDFQSGVGDKNGNKGWWRLALYTPHNISNKKKSGSRPKKKSLNDSSSPNSGESSGLPGSTSPKLIPMRKNSISSKSGGRKLSRSSLPARLRTKAKFSGNNSGTYLDDEEEEDDIDDGLSGENENGFNGEPDSTNRSRDRADTWDFGSISFGADNNSMSVLDEDEDDEVEDEDEEMDDDYKEEEERRLAELAAAVQPSSKKAGHRSRSVSRTTILGDRLMEMNINSNGHSGHSRLGLSPKSAHNTPRDHSGSGSGSLSHSRDSSREAALVEIASILANSVAPDPPQTPMISINDIAAAASATITLNKEEEAAAVKAENAATDGMTPEQMKVQLQLQQLMILQQQGQLVQIHEREKLVDQQSKLLRDLQRQLEIDEEALRIKKGDFDRLKERELSDMAHERMQIQLKENELKMKEQQLNKIVGELSSKYNVKFPEFNFV
eukprot:TRINITY_DN3618_c0_g1_i1.p1 TRINITY_DN3618_c0_g1~~TRINITY_DN3618_c0_g1_i1.p1  ORF type:complete len:594 (-),score=145.94 TRINITY_DN3618_c0_g1_i1:336-2117(-)